MGNVVDRREYDKKFEISLARLEEKLDGVIKRLDKINGSIFDYQVTRDRTNKNCDDIEKIENKQTESTKKLDKLFVKIAGFMALFGSLGAGAGSLVTFFVLRGLGG